MKTLEQIRAEIAALDAQIESNNRRLAHVDKWSGIFTGYLWVVGIALGSLLVGGLLVIAFDEDSRHFWLGEPEAVEQVEEGE